MINVVLYLEIHSRSPLSNIDQIFPQKWGDYNITSTVLAKLGTPALSIAKSFQYPGTATPASPGTETVYSNPYPPSASTESVPDSY